MNTCVTPACMYGTETLALTELLQQRLQVCENNLVRKITRVTRTDRRRMVELREETGVQMSLTDRLVRSRLQWTGHVGRMADDRLPKRAAELREHGRRRRVGQCWDGRTVLREMRWRQERRKTGKRSQETEEGGKDYQMRRWKSCGQHLTPHKGKKRKRECMNIEIAVVWPATMEHWPSARACLAHHNNANFSCGHKPRMRNIGAVPGHLSQSEHDLAGSSHALYITNQFALPLHD